MARRVQAGCTCLAVFILLSAAASVLGRQLFKREIITADEGWFYSPNWPSAYPPNFNGTLRAVGAGAGCSPSLPCAVTLSYDYSIEDSADCVYDRLVLHYGTTAARHVCGNGTAVFGPVVSDGRGVAVHFTSDFSVESSGFRIRYLVTREITTTTAPATTTAATVAPDGRALPIAGTINKGCDVERWGNSGVFLSPYYPNLYPPNQDCYYVAHLNSPFLSLHVNVAYDIEHVNNCLFDYLELTSVSGTMLCGQTTTVLDVIVTGTEFKVRFHSDNSVARKGFNLTYGIK